MLKRSWRQYIFRSLYLLLIVILLVWRFFLMRIGMKNLTGNVWQLCCELLLSYVFVNTTAVYCWTVGCYKSTVQPHKKTEHHFYWTCVYTVNCWMFPIYMAVYVHSQQIHRSTVSKRNYMQWISYKWCSVDHSYTDGTGNVNCITSIFMTAL
jgi:hypothetical protein